MFILPLWAELMQAGEEYQALLVNIYAGMVKPIHAERKMIHYDVIIHHQG